MTKCTPCEKVRIEKIIAKLKQLHAVEYFTDDGHDNYDDNNNALYIKTFLISDKRNNNGWRADWASIKKNIKSFVGKPGIEYKKCGIHGCMLDHTDGHSYDNNIHIQEKYRVSTIVNTILDEATHTAYAIHKIEDDTFAEKIRREEIQYLSPAIWPNKEKTTMHLTDDDEWYIDTTDWQGLHDAFVDSPAYGHQAKIVGQCEGSSSECLTELDNKLLTGKAYGMALLAKSRQ